MAFKPIDQGVPPKSPKTRPLQLKRGSAAAFKKANPILLNGEPGFEYDTFKLKVGDGYTRYNDLPYIGDFNKPEDGKSAYELWLEEGHTGTLTDFLESLIGPTGKSAYEIWLTLGHEGTVEDFIDYITGKSAYEVWIDAGYEGTVDDYLDWLRTTTWGTF